jgi:hypothetical protein
MKPAGLGSESVALLSYLEGRAGQMAWWLTGCRLILSCRLAPKSCSNAPV